MAELESSRENGAGGMGKTAMTSRKPADKVRNQLFISRGAGLVVIHVVGMGNMVTASVLTEMTDQERRAGFRRFIFDLSECRGLDSTFMGCMVGLCNALQRGNTSAELAAVRGTEELEPLVPMSPEEAVAELKRTLSGESGGGPVSEAPGLVIAVNVTPECIELMNILGVDKFVRVGGAVDLSQLERAALPGRDIPSDERRRMILSAHANLVEIDRRNEEKFGAFLRRLSEELAKDKQL